MVTPDTQAQIQQLNKAVDLMIMILGSIVKAHPDLAQLRDDQAQVAAMAHRIEILLKRQ